MWRGFLQTTTGFCYKIWAALKKEWRRLKAKYRLSRPPGKKKKRLVGKTSPAQGGPAVRSGRTKPARLLTRNAKTALLIGGMAGGLLLLSGIIFTQAPLLEAQEDDIIARISNYSTEEIDRMRQEDSLHELLSEFEDLGLVRTSGYINLRSAPDELDMTNIIGRLDDGAGVDIIDDLGEWLHVSSGELTGYCLAADVVRGNEARDEASEYICDRVVVTTEVLNIRRDPEIKEDNIIVRARMGDRYILLGIDGEWARIQDATAFIGTDPDSGITTTQGYVNIGDGNAEIRKCLGAARSLDLKVMATTQYEELVLAMPQEDAFINIREEPDTSGGIDNIIGKFIRGDGAELLETVTGADSNTWYRISSGGITGYVRADFCLTGDNAKKAALDYAKLTAYVNVPSLRVRTSPDLDTNDNIWTHITQNQAYEVIDQLDGWVEIALDAGDEEGEADRSFISTRDNNVIVRYGLEEAIEYQPAVEAANAAAAFRNEIVNFAVQYLGGSYVWGGTTLGVGVDCSGFVLRVYERYGIYLPRTSRDQARSGVRVTSDVMKPGDLVFYASSSGTINHVAIYIGNGQVICAASRRSGIRIYRWNYRTPVAIRNVIGE